MFSLLHVVSPDEATKGEIPLGKPLQNVRTFVVDRDLNPVKPGKIGELLVSGTGVAGGYLNNQSATDKAFIHAPHLTRTVRGETSMVYKTGDLVYVGTQGNYYFIGRCDNQVKLRGHRVELEALEAVFLQTGLLKAVAIVKVAPKEVSRAQFLLAFCMPATCKVTSDEITKSYMEEAPECIVPRVELIDKLPLTATGKVDRALLENQYFQRLSASRTKKTKFQREQFDVAAEIECIWADVFGIDIDQVSRTEGFLAVGGTSLEASMIISRVNSTFNTSLQVRRLFENTTIERLARVVMSSPGSSERLAPQTDEESWCQDSRLGQHLQPIDGRLPSWQDPSEGRVFLTGATGFVGIFLLVTLLQRADVKKVACLVRSDNKTSAESRLQQTLEKYSLTADLTKVVALPGSLAWPKLGLSPIQYDYYAEWASAVYHLGAKVSYLAPYSSHREGNVLGTIRIIEFMNHKRLKPLHYTSTIAAYGPTGYITGAKLVPEDERPTSHSAALSYDTGYAQSKYVAEEIVWDAMENGFPVAIYRPGFVLGHSKTGVCNDNDFVSRLHNTCMDMGVYPLLPDQRKEFVSVDFVVNAILHISSFHHNLGHAYNLVQPDTTNSLDVNACFDILNRISPRKMRGIPYSRWVNLLCARSESTLKPLIPCLQERVLGEKTRWEVYEKMAQYGRENLYRALQDTPETLKCDPLEVLFRKMLSSWLPFGVGSKQRGEFD